MTICYLPFWLKAILQNYIISKRIYQRVNTVYFEFCTAATMQRSGVGMWGKSIKRADFPSHKHVSITKKIKLRKQKLWLFKFLPETLFTTYQTPSPTTNPTHNAKVCCLIFKFLHNWTVGGCDITVLLHHHNNLQLDLPSIIPKNGEGGLEERQGTDTPFPPGHRAFT